MIYVVSGKATASQHIVSEQFLESMLVALLFAYNSPPIPSSDTHTHTLICKAEHAETISQKWFAWCTQHNNKTTSRSVCSHPIRFLLAVLGQGESLRKARSPALVCLHNYIYMQTSNWNGSFVVVVVNGTVAQDDGDDDDWKDANGYEGVLCFGLVSD